MTIFKIGWDWLKAHPNVRCAILCLLMLMLGAGASFYLKPAQVLEKTKIVTVTKTDIQYKDRIVTNTVYVQAEKKHVHKETTTTKAKDGTEVTKTTTDTNVDENTSNHSTTDAEHQEVVKQVVTQVVEKEKLVLRQPDWRVFAGVGYQFAKFAGQSETGVPGLNGVVIQVGADRRILGPVFVGLSLNTQYTAFFNLSATF